MKYKDITKNPRIDNVTVDKAGIGLNLYFELDGVPYEVTGEFYIDKKGVLHHDAIDADGNEVPIMVQMEF